MENTWIALVLSDRSKGRTSQRLYLRRSECQQGLVILGWTERSTQLTSKSVSTPAPLFPTLHQLLMGVVGERGRIFKKTKQHEENEGHVMHDRCGSLLGQTSQDAGSGFPLVPAIKELFWKPRQVPLKHSLTLSLTDWLIQQTFVDCWAFCLGTRAIYTAAQMFFCNPNKHRAYGAYCLVGKTGTCK